MSDVFLLVLLTGGMEGHKKNLSITIRDLDGIPSFASHCSTSVWERGGDFLKLSVCDG